MLNLSVNVGRLRLKNPVTVASGVFGYGEEFKDLIDLKKLGAITTKTITLKPKEGNPQPRIFETASGLLNSIGLENPGLDIFVKEKLPFLKKTQIPVIVSIWGNDLEEFVELAKRLDRIRDIAGIELNLSCPNIKSSKIKDQRVKLIAQETKATNRTTKAVRKATSKTLIVKLSPNVTDIADIARSAEDAGADAVNLINTFFGLAMDWKKKALITGGLSGPAIKPLALRAVYEAYKSVEIPIIGTGGIMNTTDALEFIMCGATAIGIGTANLINPRVTIEVIDGLKNHLRNRKIIDIKELIGSFHHLQKR